MEYQCPDKWVVIKITRENGEALYKVFASYYGGYLGSDSWKLNSGIKEILTHSTFHNCDPDEQEECFKRDYIDFIGYSGSVYRCVIGCYGTNLYTQGVLNEIIKIIKENNIEVEILPETTDWSKLLTNSLT